jgi:uncharacterized protein YcfJ
MNTFVRSGSLLAALALTACVTIPTGPSYTAMPGSRKTFDQFQVDDASCRQFAVQATGGTPNDAAANAAVGSAVVGTLLGAAIGGAVGGGEGAAVGAGMGLFTGSAVGAGNAQVAGYSTQQRYDSSYYQCMYANAQVPMPAVWPARWGGQQQRTPVFGSAQRRRSSGTTAARCSGYHERSPLTWRFAERATPTSRAEPAVRCARRQRQAPARGGVMALTVAGLAPKSVARIV